MAHWISYKPEGIILSSAIGNIGIDVDGSYVDVTLTAPGGIDILSERYFAYGGVVTLYDPASLIEAEMRRSHYSTADFTLSVFTDSPGNNADTCVLHVLYCDRFSVCGDVAKFLQENFLTTLSMRRVAPGSTVSLFFYVQSGESVEYTVVHNFRKKDSEAIWTHSISMQSGESASSGGVEQINLAVEDIIAEGASFASAEESEIEPVSFTVRCGQRSISFFIDRSLAGAPSFFFRNCFNVWESVALPATTTAKTDVERSTAVINGIVKFYNQSATKNYEVEAGPLTSDEGEWIDQLLTSYDVFRVERDRTTAEDPYVLAQILITDSSCEIEDGDEKLNSVKFTWRYANNRPMVHLSASPGIFTSPYDPVFS